MKKINQNRLGCASFGIQKIFLKDTCLYKFCIFKGTVKDVKTNIRMGVDVSSMSAKTRLANYPRNTFIYRAGIVCGFLLVPLPP